MLNEVTDAVMVKLGYTTYDNKLIDTDVAGKDGEQVKGYYSEITKDAYINDKYNDSTKDLISTAGHEATHAMDQQSNIQSEEAYSNNFGENLSSYTEFVLDITNQGSMAQTNNHTQPQSVVEYIQLQQNNSEFTWLDKAVGDNLSVKDGADISKHVYKDDQKFKLPQYIQEVIDETTLNKYGLSQKDLINEKTGFKSAVYVNKITGEVTYAYAGTDGLDSKDIRTNLIQGVGLTSDAYRQAIANAIKFNDATQKLGVKASLTGHSLGGGEAAAASEKTSLEAKTYNAAGVHPITVISGKGTNNIDNYYMKHDPLTNLQNSYLILPDASGKQHQINPQESSSILQNIKDGHSIDTIINNSNLKDAE
jgi:hypothetical protein